MGALGELFTHSNPLLYRLNLRGSCGRLARFAPILQLARPHKRIRRIFNPADKCPMPGLVLRISLNAHMPRRRNGIISGPGTIETAQAFAHRIGCAIPGFGITVFFASIHGVD